MRFENHPLSARMSNRPANLLSRLPASMLFALLLLPPMTIGGDIQHDGGWEIHAHGYSLEDLPCATVYLRLVDNRGNRPTLNACDFTVRSRAFSAGSVFPSPDKTPEVAILIDNTSNFLGTGIKRFRSLLNRLLTDLNPEWPVALYTTGRDGNAVAEEACPTYRRRSFTGRRHILRQDGRDISYIGQTDVASAWTNLIDDLEHRQGRRAVVFVTRGTVDDVDSSATAGLLSRIDDAGFPVIVVSAHGRRNFEEVRPFARVSGGAVAD
ncbi:MAG: hypothetical protein ACOC6C_04490, partial [Verrucomicrobiota bacterium]